MGISAIMRSMEPRLPGNSGFNLPDPGFKAFVDTAKQQQDKLRKALEGLPIKRERFSVEEIRKIIEVNKRLKAFIEEDERSSAAGRDSRQSAETLRRVITYLDGVDLFKAKFTTGTVGKIQEEDSVYYATKDGIALRLKAINLRQKGLRRVIQPFMESIVFSYDQFYPRERPAIGGAPSEYCSQEFYNLQNQDEAYGDFTSEVKKFYKDGRLYFVEGPTNLFHEHPGSDINRVYFDRL